MSTEPVAEFDEFGRVDLTSAERAVLAAVVESDGVCLDDLSLTPADFDDVVHGQMFEAMQRARLEGRHVTYATLSDAFPREAVVVASLPEYGLLKYALDEHAAIVAKQGLRRRLGAAAAGISQRASERSITGDDLIEQARALVDEAVGEQRRPVRFVRDVLPGVIDSMEDGASNYLPTPWPSLDAAIGGFRPGGVYVIGGRPAQGKSVIAGQCAIALAAHGPVAFSSLEMSAEELTQRFISARVPLDVTKVQEGKLSEKDWVRLAQRKRSVADLPIAIDERSNVTVADIRQFARSVSRHGNLAGVIVDYLQLIAGLNSRMDRRLQIEEASRLLKVLAKDLRCPVIVLSQLNRESEKRADPRPRLAELKEAGGIEQDADVVILLYREKVLAGHKITLDIAKSRHREAASIDLLWQGALSRAVEWPTKEENG